MALKYVCVYCCSMLSWRHHCSHHLIARGLTFTGDFRSALHHEKITYNIHKEKVNSDGANNYERVTSIRQVYYDCSFKSDFKPGAHGPHAWFLEIALVCMSVCVCVRLFVRPQRH